MCDENKDYYLVNTGGDWTATEARYESADTLNHTLDWSQSTGMTVAWQSNDANCEGGFDVSIPFGDDQRICHYTNYPLFYEVDIVPPSGPTVVQVNAAPAGDQGLSQSYSSGFSFTLTGVVQVSGNGPVGGLQAGLSWNNTVSTSVPPLAIDAGDTGPGNEGAFTRYRYCTVGTDANCTSSIQMTGASGTCRQFVVGSPQNGQTPNGRLSNVAQTVYWQVDPNTYGGATTFDIAVTWTVELATSTSFLWAQNLARQGGPMGYCNTFGCSCGIATSTAPITLSQTFKVPPPSSSQCPS
jgi:hypothetical protein